MSQSIQFILYFFLASAVTVLVQAMVREPTRTDQMLGDARHFFFLIVGGIGLFSIIVVVLENLFVHPIWHF